MLEEDKGYRKKRKANSLGGNGHREVGLKILILNSVVKYLMLRGELGLEGVVLKIQRRRICQTAKKKKKSV